MLELKLTSTFKKDLKRIAKRNKNIVKLNFLTEKLLNNEKLPAKYKDHHLINYGDYMSAKECHIEPDWLLSYYIDAKKLILVLIRTGSHSDLF